MSTWAAQIQTGNGFNILRAYTHYTFSSISHQDTAEQLP